MLSPCPLSDSWFYCILIKMFIRDLVNFGPPCIDITTSLQIWTNVLNFYDKRLIVTKTLVRRIKYKLNKAHIKALYLNMLHFFFSFFFCSDKNWAFKIRSETQSWSDQFCSSLQKSLLLSDLVMMYLLTWEILCYPFSINGLRSETYMVLVSPS